MKKHTIYHKNGTVWGKGLLFNEVEHGYWEWYRKDGTKLRSGYFDKGKKVGIWTTYDKVGAVYKVTEMKLEFFVKVSAPAKRALLEQGIKSVKDLSQFTKAQIKNLHGVGPTTIPKLENVLKQYGLSFKYDKKA